MPTTPEVIVQLHLWRYLLSHPPQPLSAIFCYLLRCAWQLNWAAPTATLCWLWMLALQLHLTRA
jgi:hypothetical protein